MPITASTFIVAWLSIAGVPPFSGFWSKDQILANAWERSPALWAVGAITALLTAYYMSRQVFLVFFGKPRWEEAADTKSPEEAEAQPEHEPAATEGAHEQAEAAHGARGDFRPHESPWTMALPLVTLAFLAAVAGVLNLPFGRHIEFLGSWFEPFFGAAERPETLSGLLQIELAVSVLVLVLIGIGIAYFAYLKHRIREQALEPAVLQHAWYFDAFIAAMVDGPVRLVAVWTAYVFDLKFIDGAVNGVASIVSWGAGKLRLAQTGYIRNYALGIAVGAFILVGLFLTRTGA
jgi:NADH-quinone oxidoreductase subunit L